MDEDKMANIHASNVFKWNCDMRVFMKSSNLEEGNENKQHEKMCSQTAMARLARVDNLWFIIAHPKFPFSNETR